MTRNVGACGIVCSNCPAFQATQENDDTKRAKVAEEWSLEPYPIRPGDVNCDGCMIEGGRTMVFVADCIVRSCAAENGYETCAECADFGCEKLDMPWKMSPDARKVLEELRDRR
jgi:hypothetical protein